MTIKDIVQEARNKLSSIQSDEVRITFEIQREPKSKVTYNYKKEITDDFINALEIHYCDYPTWRIGTYYDLDNKKNFDIDVEVKYVFEDFEAHAYKSNESQFEVRYTYKASVEMSKENAAHYLFDCSKVAQVQDIMFHFVLNGETLYPDDHPDLTLDYAMFSPLIDISVESV